MEPLPKKVEYYVETAQEERYEWKNGVRVLVGYEDVDYVHRVVTKDDNGRLITVSDTRVSTDPAEWRKNNPNLPLRGELPDPRKAAHNFLANASPEELAELGLRPIEDELDEFLNEDPVEEAFEELEADVEARLAEPEDPVDAAEAERARVAAFLEGNDDEE